MSEDLQRVANLAALDPALAERLSAPLPATRVGRDAHGAPTWTRFRNPRPLDDSEAMAQVTSLGDGDAPVVLIGLGSGDRLAWLLAHTQRVVYAWDLDAGIWDHVLRHHELTAALQAGRLVPLFGPDLLHVQLPAQTLRCVHPTFAAAYVDAVALLDHRGPVALVVQGELFVDDVAEALREAGFRVFRWDVAHLSRREHDHILRTSGAALAVCINTQEGLAEVLALHRVPLVVWEVDPNTSGPAVVHGPSDRVHVFTYRARNVPELRRAGYRHVHPLPLAANPGRFDAAPTPPTVPIAFVGASMAQSAQRMRGELRARFGATPQVLAKLERVLDLQRQDASRWRVPELLESLTPGLRARIRRDHAGLDLALMLGEISAAEKRLTWLAHLGGVGLHVWGDPGWSLAQSHGVVWEGWADHFVDLPRIYATAAIHVDVPRLYQQDAVAMRIFDVLAAGGFLLAEHSPELVALFRPGVELETYRSPQELVDKARFYLGQPELRRTVAAAGRARVLADHTIGHRLATMLGTLGLSAPASPGPSGPRSP